MFDKMHPVLRHALGIVTTVVASTLIFALLFSFVAVVDAFVASGPIDPASALEDLINILAFSLAWGMFGLIGLVLIGLPMHALLRLVRQNAYLIYSLGGMVGTSIVYLYLVEFDFSKLGDPLFLLSIIPGGLGAAIFRWIVGPGNSSKDPLFQDMRGLHV